MVVYVGASIVFVMRKGNKESIHMLLISLYLVSVDIRDVFMYVFNMWDKEFVK